MTVACMLQLFSGLHGALAVVPNAAIPEFTSGPGGVESLMFEDYVKLTSGLTMPAIVKGFFDPKKFDEVCACSSDASFFDGLNFPFTAAGNPSFEFRTAMQEQKHMRFDALNGGDFYRNHACAKDRDDYIFYDINNGALVSASVQDFFRNKVDPLLHVSEKLEDKSHYDEWFNEIFIGGSTTEYPLPGKDRGGSPPHRAPVLNYYHQICGRKRWYIAPHGTSFGEWDKLQILVGEEDMHNYMKHKQVYVGETEPGDVLLNPPWLWHFVQAGHGFNFAVTYKQNNFAWWAAINKMDPTHVAVNMQYGAFDLRYQKLPATNVNHLALGGAGLYGTQGAFIINLWDFRVPMWLLKRFQREVSVLLWISIVTYTALAFTCCAGCCWCSRKPRHFEADAESKRSVINQTKVTPKPKPSSTVQLDVDDLDEDERKALMEASKKGYYHGRPKNDDSTAPAKVASTIPMECGKRVEFDKFQKKWDQFDNDNFVKQL